MATVMRTYPCLQCGRIINTTMTECRYCSSQIDHEQAEQAASIHEAIQQAGFHAAMLKQAAIWLPVALLLTAVPLVGMVGFRLPRATRRRPSALHTLVGAVSWHSNTGAGLPSVEEMDCDCPDHLGVLHDADTCEMALATRKVMMVGAVHPTYTCAQSGAPQIAHLLAVETGAEPAQLEEIDGRSDRSPGH